MRRVKPRTSKTVVERLKRVIFPVSCLSCGEEDDWLCNGCFKQIKITPSGICRICHKAGENGICALCQRQLKIDAIISPFSYNQEAVKSLIKQAKFLGYHDGLRFLTERVRPYVLSLIVDNDAICSYIPVSSERKKERGFDQARLIAKSLFGELYQVVPLLRKTRHTLPQAQLQGKERSKNVLGAYQAITYTPKSVILCDDVVTTGSTAKEAAKTLRQAGAKQIVLVALAHG